MFYETFSKTSANKPPTSAKVPQLEAHFLTVAQAAERLGTWPSTITRWCESGKLPAIPKSYGSKTTYLIAPTTIELLLAQADNKQAGKQPRKPKIEEHKAFFDAWKKAMGKGLIDGKVFSSRTIEDYSYYATAYFSQFQQVSIEGLKAGLSKISAAQVATRQKYFKAIRCLAKFLIAEGVLEESFLEAAKPLSPKYHQQPKRHTVSAENLKTLLAVARSTADKAIVLLLSQTGVRASEACELLIGDVDLEKGFLIVRLGKGGKSRKIGLSAKVVEALQAYLSEHPKPTLKQYLFLNASGNQLDRNMLYQRLRRLGNKAGIKVSPHALRRAFVTINANAGRPLQMLQMACGHSDIKTTMGYCRTSEQEMIAAMQNW